MNNENKKTELKWMMMMMICYWTNNLTFLITII